MCEPWQVSRRERCLKESLGECDVKSTVCLTEKVQMSHVSIYALGNREWLSCYKWSLESLHHRKGLVPPWPTQFSMTFREEKYFRYSMSTPHVRLYYFLIGISWHDFPIQYSTTGPRNRHIFVSENSSKYMKFHQKRVKRNWRKEWWYKQIWRDFFSHSVQQNTDKLVNDGSWAGGMKLNSFRGSRLPWSCHFFINKFTTVLWFIDMLT